MVVLSVVQPEKELTQLEWQRKVILEEHEEAKEASLEAWRKELRNRIE
ncbi:hypothetical protein [Aureibacillus halotolerans]|uniref:Uncharacterized protein n=1 Tax=Aureibacillus halotolerans TaxID=1508390 RepID=A0A4R6TS14_9BACI|nr:hypothetical protein [Aureibacillus halotolerans]TDQ35257.1 hypothetical protein EV213_12244 [Aureibacillus halotolerans]